MKRRADYFFEVSFEIANKYGGIYTVISSKVSEMKKYYGENYCAIGFFDPVKSKTEFEPRSPGKLRPVFDELAKEGIMCYYGVWNIPEKPKTILVDIKNYLGKTDEIKKELWNRYKIDSLNTPSDFDEPIVWSYAVGKLLEKLSEVYGDKKIVAQFHEWLSGGALLYVKKKKLDIGLVFTTHATMLGRTMAGHGEDLPKQIEKGLKEKKCVDVKKAYGYNMQAKHLAEKVCAKEADVFTTVSDGTAEESEYILGKKPDIILPNGLYMNNFPAMEELAYLHRKYKGEIVAFLRGYFAPYYDIDIKDIRIMFISGRYEFHNKGIDIFIKSLGKLNRELKQKRSSKDVFAFFFIPSDVRGENLDVLENISLFKEIEDRVDDLLPDMKEKILQSLVKGEKTHRELLNFLRTEMSEKFNKLIVSFKSRRNKTLPLCVFDLNYEPENDAIIHAFEENELLNKKEDKVKVIFYPVYISPTDRLLAMEYYPAMIGCSLGVFPSYYEPWGYTPLEAAANGVISITTDHSGFGRFIQKNVGKTGKRGIVVLNMKNKNEEDVVNDLSHKIKEIINLDKHEIISRKHDAKNLANLAGWKKLSKYYIEAHNIALEKCKNRLK